jgi:ubiquinone/menaquinone biosynthesis C-methylase UbiE
MGSENQPKPDSVYGRYWDYYIESWRKSPERYGENLEWPGDEWGHPGGWDQLYNQLFQPAGVESWERAVEIGPGSGKYTLKVLGASNATVRAYDVSAAFLDVCRERCGEMIAGDRLSLHLLQAASADEMLNDLRRAEWGRQIDAVYSIDAMVHVDLQYLIAYLVTAALVLRPGGKLMLTLPDVTRGPGFAKLMKDIVWTFPSQGRAIGSGKFEWLSPDIVQSLLPRLGFQIDLLDDSQRDLRVAASLADPALAQALEHYLMPATR